MSIGWEGSKHFELLVSKGKDYGVLFWCPGCGEEHMITPQQFDQPGPKWSVNLKTLTVSPSVLVTKPSPEDPTRCHLFIRDGKIIYLNDCTHDHAGTVVPLPSFEDWED